MSGGLFSRRATKAWNALPADLAKTASVHGFKQALHSLLCRIMVLNDISACLFDIYSFFYLLLPQGGF